MAAFTKLDKAKAQLLNKSPFFATLLLGTPLIADASIPTAATDGRKIYYNAEFIDSLSLDVVQFVLAHELGHMMHEHATRVAHRDRRLYNIAGDYVINLLLADDGFTVWDQALLDEKYRNMHTEQVYNLLQKEPPKGGEGGGLGEDLMQPADGSDHASQIASDMRQRVAQAANVARMAGKMSAGIARLVDEVLNPQVRWQDVLRDYMTRSSKDDESWAHRNRRFNSVYLPARYSECMGEITLIIDTSGSIGDAELNQVAAEIQAIADHVRPERVRVVWADTKVAGEQVFEQGEELKLAPQGGGGTDMRVPLEYVTQHDPDIVVLLTDGYTPWPDVEPPYPLIVCCTTPVDVPVGDVVRVTGSGL